MADDSAEPMLVIKDEKNFQATNRNEGEVWRMVNNEQREKGETPSSQVKNLVADGGNWIRAN